MLSESARAAAVLRQSYLCNPDDLDGVKGAIMPNVSESKDRRRRMRPLRRRVLSNDIYAWARRFFDTLDAAPRALRRDDRPMSKPDVPSPTIPRTVAQNR